MAHFFLKNIFTLDKSYEHTLDFKLGKFHNLIQEFLFSICPYYSCPHKFTFIQLLS